MGWGCGEEGAVFENSAVGRSAFLISKVSQGLNALWLGVNHILKANSKTHSRTVESANLGLNPDSVTY